MTRNRHVFGLLAPLVATGRLLCACSDAPGGGAMADDVGSDLDTLDGRDAVGAIDTLDEPGEDTDDARSDVSGGDCTEGAECADGLVCVDLVAGDGGGLCAQPCIDDTQCADGSDCVLILNTGSDGVSVCVPDDYCFDADGDGFGNGPGCRGADCDDDDDLVRPGGTELCDGVDNDCDSEVDESTTVEGTPCDSGALGVCGIGLGACVGGVPDCIGAAPSGEICDGEDNDCDGTIDELAGCAEDGDDCNENADCASLLCVNGVCERADCDAIGCFDRIAATQGGERVRTDRFDLNVSFGAPVGAYRLATSRYRAAVGVGFFVRSE